MADFLFQPQRLNVAVTRPRTKLILVGSHHLLDADPWFLRRPVIILVILGIGHLIPFVLLSSIVVFSDTANGFQLSAIFGAISGLFLVLGGANIKTGITLAAGYRKKIVFKSVRNI